MSRPNGGSPTHTYAAAGVDNDARRRFIERIAPIARSTHRPEVLSGVGPFGGLFQLGSYRQPVLASSTDSVGTKVKIAALLDRFEGIGIDMGTRWELIAGRMNVEEIREHIGADSLGYLSVEGLIEAVGLPKDKFCLACFTGEYPIPVPLQLDKLALEPAGGRDRHDVEWMESVPSALRRS